MKLFWSLVLVCCAASAQFHAGIGGRGGSRHAQAQQRSYQPSPYSYGYQVSDPSTRSDFSHRQQSDSSGVISGQYQVRLPDGRIQTVTYTADHIHGYRATVEYSGEAVYPDYVPSASSIRRRKVPVRRGYHQGGRGGRIRRQFYPGRIFKITRERDHHHHHHAQPPPSQHQHQHQEALPEYGMMKK